IALAGTSVSGPTLSVLVHLLGAALCGIGYGPVTPASSQMLIRTTPPERTAFVFSLKQSGVPLGGLLVGVALLPVAGATTWVAGLMTMVGLSLLIALATNSLHEADAIPARRDVGSAGTG